MSDLIWYSLQFKPLGPLHIGQKNYGILSETRLFIPGWTMWGALVNAYGKLKGGRSKDFEKGKELLEKITCFYPQEEDGRIMFPCFRGGQLFLGNISEEEFRNKYTDTYVSTAIMSECIAAKDGSLHETELLLPQERGGGQGLCWVGLMGIDKGQKSEVEKFLKQISTIRVGGDAAYGFGRMRLFADSVKGSVNKSVLWEWGLNEIGSLTYKMDETKDGVYDDEATNEDNNKSKERDNIKNYIKFHPDYKIKEGKLEFIVQYDFSGDGPLIKTKGYYLIPGSQIVADWKNKDRPILKKGAFM